MEITNDNSYMRNVYYHVTEKGDAEKILQEGFEPGWGDIGFGIYFWGTLNAARKYASQGGWDGDLEFPTILQVWSPDIRPVYNYEIHPDWPNQQDYQNIYFWEGDEDENEFFYPTEMEIIEEWRC